MKYGSATSSVTSGRLDIYVDDVNGSDSSTGLDTGSKLKTVTEAEKRIPDLSEDLIVIHLAPHSGDGYEMPTFRPRLLRRDLVVIGDSGGARDDGFNELVGTTALVAGSGQAAAVTAGGLGVNTYRGKTIEVLTGDAAGDRRIIRDHTDTTITPCYFFSAALADGDEIRIVEPAVKIVVPDGEASSRYWQVQEPSSAPTISNKPAGDNPLGTVRAALSLVNLRNDSNDFQSLHLGGLVKMYGMDFEGTGQSQFHGGGGLIGWEKQLDTSGDIAPLGVELGAPSDKSWLGWGLNVGGICLIASGAKVSIVGLVADRLASQGAYVMVIGANLWNFGCRALYTREEAASVIILSGKTPGPDIPVLIDGLLWGARADGPRSFITLETTEIVDVSGGPAFLAQDGGFVYGASDVTVTASATGLKAERDGKIHFISTLNLTTAGNDVEVGNGPTVGSLAVDFTADGDFIGTGDGSVVQRIPLR